MADDDMTVADLKALLKGHPDDARVVLSQDKAGSGFSPLLRVEPGCYDAIRPWAGEFTGRDAAVASGRRCAAVCLWPTR